MPCKMTFTLAHYMALSFVTELSECVISLVTFLLKLPISKLITFIDYITLSSNKALKSLTGLPSELRQNCLK